MSLLKTIKAQLGLSGTPANNFCLDASADNGTMKLARGNAGATTQDVMTVDAAGKVAFPATPRVYLPGEVLQIVTHFDAGAAQSASDWINLTSVAASITPKSTNSKLIVECFADVQVNNISGVNAQAVFQIYSGTGPPPAGTFGNYVSPRAFSAAGGIGINCGVALMAVVANTDLTPKSYRLGGSPLTGLPNIIGGTQQAWKITEVQN